MRFLIGVLLLLSLSEVYAATTGVTLTHLTGSIYLVEDSHYAKTNSLVYIGQKSVTVIGATHTPETAKLLAEEIRQEEAGFEGFLQAHYNEDGTLISGMLDLIIDNFQF